MKKIIGYDKDGNPNCACSDGNIYTNCGKNCECCDQVGSNNNKIDLLKDQVKYKTTSCPCSFYAVKNKFGNLECEMDNFGVKKRVTPIQLANHTINGSIPKGGDKWDCIDSKNCGYGNTKWDTLHIVRIEHSQDDKFVPIIDSAHSTSNCYIPKTTLDMYAEYNPANEEKRSLEVAMKEDEGIDINDEDRMINNLPLFSDIKQAQWWEYIKGSKTGLTSEYFDDGVIKHIPGSGNSNTKLITRCYINNKDIIGENILHNWDYKTYSSMSNKLEVKAVGELLKIKIQGDNSPTVDISIKDSSNRSLLKRKLKNIAVNGEYILKQKIPALVTGKTQETYNITITPSADTKYYYENGLISAGVLKYTIWQFKNPTITFKSMQTEGINAITNTTVSSSAATITSSANSFSYKPVTSTINVSRSSGTQNYYLTKNALIFDDLIVNDSEIKKFITNQQDKKELECRDNITIAESARADLVAQSDLEIGMNFTGEIEKTKTVYKSIDLDEHLKEPCDDDEIFDILTNKFELENTTDLFSGMEVRGVDNNDFEFITLLESVDCEKGITLESHYVIKKETTLTFTYSQSATISKINKNNIEIRPCIKLPNNTEISFTKTNKSQINGRIRVDKSGASTMAITTTIENVYVGQDDIKFLLDVSKFVSVKPPSRNKYVVCGKDDLLNINFDFNDGSYNVGDIAATPTTAPKNGVLTALKVVNPRYLIYTPNAGFVGEDKFNFTLSDGVNTSDEKTIFITIR